MRKLSKEVMGLTMGLMMVTGSLYAGGEVACKSVAKCNDYRVVVSAIGIDKVKSKAEFKSIKNVYKICESLSSGMTVMALLKTKCKKTNNR